MRTSSTRLTSALSARQDRPTGQDTPKGVLDREGWRGQERRPNNPLAMIRRPMNFNPGPAALPLAALERARDELLDFAGSGMSVMEHSHRGKEYEAVHDEALALLRELSGIPEDYDVLLLQGGASMQFALLPMNFLP